MLRVLRRNWVSFAISVSTLIFGLISFGRLPQAMATHHDWRGQPDGYQGRLFGVLFLPLLAIGLMLALPALIRISPRGFKMARSLHSLPKITLAISLLLNGLQIGILMTNLQPGRCTMVPFFNVSMALFMIVAGGFLSKTERNFFIGVRTPWAIASEQNWLATHRFAAKAMVFAGVVLFPLNSFATTFAPALFLFLTAILASILYSYQYHRSETRAGIRDE